LDCNDNRKIGKLALTWGGCAFELRVLKSPAGYYLGTLDEDGVPYSRESECYWQTFEDAESALESDDWVQSLTP
jgi:hypothetical protein